MDQPEVDSPIAPVKEVRSRGGALLARIVAGQLEFKCRRSRALVRIPLQDLVAASEAGGDPVIWVEGEGRTLQLRAAPTRSPGVVQG